MFGFKLLAKICWLIMLGRVPLIMLLLAACWQQLAWAVWLWLLFSSAA
jgi:hypothetical protein